MIDATLDENKKTDSIHLFYDSSIFMQYEWINLLFVDNIVSLFWCLAQDPTACFGRIS
jgi:hypothetical protein